MTSTLPAPAGGPSAAPRPGTVARAVRHDGSPLGVIFEFLRQWVELHPDGQLAEETRALLARFASENL